MYHDKIFLIGVSACECVMAGDRWLAVSTWLKINKTIGRATGNSSDGI